MARLKLSPPWVILYREVDAMFKNDDDVMVVYDEEENEIKLYVEGEEKAGAMSELLPTEKQFGNVTLKVTVVPANGLLLNQKVSDAYRAMFEGNSAVDYIEDVEGVFSNDLHYVVFAKEVVSILRTILEMHMACVQHCIRKLRRISSRIRMEYTSAPIQKMTRMPCLISD